MAVRTISTKLAIEGEAEYKRSAASIKSELSVLCSNLDLVTSSFQGNANSMEALTAKGGALASIYDKQKEKVATLEDALKNAQRAQEEYANRVSTAQENIARCEKALEELKNSTGDTSEEQAALTAELEKWNSELSEAQGYQDAAKRGVNEWQKQLNTAKIELNDTDAAIQKNNQYLAEAEKAADGCATSIDKFGNEVKDSKAGIEALASALAAAGIAKTVKEIADELMECSEAAAGFEAAMAKVSTLADTSVVPLDTLKAQFTALSSETGVSVNALAEAAYQALSAGVDTANVVNFVSTATKTSVAGFTEASTAVDVLTTALNAYKLEGSESERVASMLVKTQDEGKTSVGELAANMGRVIPTAAAYNVSLENLTTAYALLTKNGMNTAISTTNLSAMLDELGKNGSNVSDIIKEQTGKSFAELMGSGATLSDVISVLSDSVDGNSTAFSNLWSSSTAGKAALSLLNSGADEFNATLGKMEKASGSVDRNFQTMADTTEFAHQRMVTATNNLQIAIGDALNPALEKLYNTGADAFGWASDFVAENPWLVQAMTGAAVAVGLLSGGIAAYTAVTAAAKVAQDALNLSMGLCPIVAVTAAVGALVFAVGSWISSLGSADKETKEFTESLKESKQAHEELTESMEERQANTENLLAALEAELAVEEKTAAQKDTILELIHQLNEAVPELGLAYDEEHNALVGLTEAEVEAMIQRAAAQEEYEAQVARLSELKTEQAEINARLQEAEATLAEAQEAGAWNTRALQNNVDELTKAYEANQAEIASLEEESAAYAEWQKASQTATTEMTSTVTGLIAEMEALEQSYQDAHDEAKKSIEAQLGLFNELDGSAKTSIDNLIETLKGQVDYMDTYAENIKRAMELGVDEGLIQKLSDGSQESAQILAAIVAGGEEDIVKLNEQLARVEEGKENFSSTVAEMETDFSEKMSDLEKRVTEAVDNLNVSVEAGAAGAATIQGYIDGAEGMRAQLVAKYESLANAANGAYKKVLEIHSPSRVFREDGQNSIKGAIVGAEDERSNLEEAYTDLGSVATEAFKEATATSGEFGEMQEENATATERMTQAVDGLVDEMANLEESYTSAYDKAKRSIDGQLGLFEAVTPATSGSMDSFIYALRTQEDFLATYTANIQKALDRGVNKEIVESLSNGSEESAATLATIVNGTDEGIEALNRHFAKVSEGKAAFSSTVAEMETDFSKKMGELEDRVKETVEELDVSIEAAAAGADTIQGYIDGADSMREKLVAKYSELAKAASSAYSSAIKTATPTTSYSGTVSTASAFSTPRTTTEPTQSKTATKEDTAAILAELKGPRNTAAPINVSIVSPKALNEKETAREFKKVQRDLTLSQ